MNHITNKIKGGFTMTPKSIVLAVVMIVFLLPVSGFAEGVTAKDFDVSTAQQFVNLCTAMTDDPHVVEAINFCYGYFEGAYQYYDAMTSGPEGNKFVCVPEPKPTLKDAVSMFMEWIQSNTQYMNERPVEAQFRFLMHKWPCK